MHAMSAALVRALVSHIRKWLLLIAYLVPLSVKTNFRIPVQSSPVQSSPVISSAAISDTGTGQQFAGTRSVCYPYMEGE